MDTALFVLGRLAALAVAPDNWLIAGLALTVIGQLCCRLRLARWAGALTLLAALALAILPIGDLALRPLETRHPPTPVVPAADGILVLGGSESGTLTAFWGPVQLNEAAERMTEAMVLARRHPEAMVVFSGGAGALRDVLGDGVPGAVVARRFFAEQGLAPERLILEGGSRNTAENARLSLAQVAPGDGERWILVTSAFHMPRALMSFRAAGWPGELIPWPVDHRGGPVRLGWNMTGQMTKLHVALREYLGMASYRVLGRG